MHKLLKKLDRELKKYEDKEGDLTSEDWKCVFPALEARYHLLTTMAMTGEDEDGNWENNRPGRTGYRRYSDSYSGGQRRNRDYPYGYSGSSKNMLDTLYDMLDDAESEDERMAIQRRINKMERHY